MPKTKLQGAFFGLLMSITMAYGMEVYNMAIKTGGLSVMTNKVFGEALLETSYMWLFVFVISNLWGNRLGHLVAGKVLGKENNPLWVWLMTSAATVLVMCPSMSAVAAVLFSVVLGGGSWGELPAYWVRTVLQNFPMALLWNLFAAGPVTRLLFRKIFPQTVS